MAKIEIVRRYDADGQHTHVDDIEVEVWIDVDRPESCGWGDTEPKLVVCHEAHIRHRAVFGSCGLIKQSYTMGAPTELTESELDEVCQQLTKRLEPLDVPRGHVIRHLTETLLDSAKGELRYETSGKLVSEVAR